MSPIQNHKRHTYWQRFHTIHYKQVCHRVSNRCCRSSLCTSGAGRLRHRIHRCHFSYHRRNAVLRHKFRFRATCNRDYTSPALRHSTSSLGRIFRTTNRPMRHRTILHRRVVHCRNGAFPCMFRAISTCNLRYTRVCRLASKLSSSQESSNRRRRHRRRTIHRHRVRYCHIAIRGRVWGRASPHFRHTFREHSPNNL